MADLVRIIIAALAIIAGPLLASLIESRLPAQARYNSEFHLRGSIVFSSDFRLRGSIR